MLLWFVQWIPPLPGVCEGLFPVSVCGFGMEGFGKWNPGSSVVIGMLTGL